MRHRDPVTPEVYRAVRLRDLWGCVAVHMPLAPRALEPCQGSVELDHVHNGGLGKRGPSTVANLVSLCRFHHRAKTENARIWRQHLDTYLARRVVLT